MEKGLLLDDLRPFLGLVVREVPEGEKSSPILHGRLRGSTLAAPLWALGYRAALPKECERRGESLRRVL